MISLMPAPPPHTLHTLSGGGGRFTRSQIIRKGAISTANFRNVNLRQIENEIITSQNSRLQTFGIVEKSERWPACCMLFELMPLHAQCISVMIFMFLLSFLTKYDYTDQIHVSFTPDQAQLDQLIQTRPHTNRPTLLKLFPKKKCRRTYNAPCSYSFLPAPHSSRYFYWVTGHNRAP